MCKNKQQGVKVRDFFYPPYEPRHFGIYPSLNPFETWNPRIVRRPFKNEQCLLLPGDEILVKQANIMFEDGMMVCRLVNDHLPNNTFSVPVWILKEPDQ
jgi:hypothetical protein